MLSDLRILTELQSGNIVINPFDEQQLGTNSYDCRIGPWYYESDPDWRVLALSDRAQLRGYWGKALHSTSEIMIRPGATILAHTQEVIGGTNGFVAHMHCRSTVARAGLSVCRCAGVGDVGYINHWTMEINNHTRSAVFIPVGYRVCQMMFDEVGPTRKEYSGAYQTSDWKPEDMLPKAKADWDSELLPRLIKEDVAKP